MADRTVGSGGTANFPMVASNVTIPLPDEAQLRMHRRADGPHPRARVRGSDGRFGGPLVWTESFVAGCFSRWNRIGTVTAVAIVIACAG